MCSRVATYRPGQVRFYVFMVVLAGWPSAVANRKLNEYENSSRWRHHDDSIGAGGEARPEGGGAWKEGHMRCSCN